MKLILSLSVLAVALLMVLEGPAPAQAETSLTEELSKFGTTVKDKLMEAVDSVKKINFSEPWSWLSEKLSTLKTTFS